MPRSVVTFFASDVLSLLGNAAVVLVLPYLVLLRTGDPAAAGIVAATSAVPGFIAAVVGGALVDRIGRRRMTIIADLGSAVSVALLAIIDATLGLTLGWFIALGLLGALFDVPGMTARDAMLGRVAQVAKLSIDRVAGVRRAAYGLAFLIGPALAGLALTLLPAPIVLSAVAGCSALAALLAFASPRSLAQFVVDEKLPRAVGPAEAAPPAPEPFGWHQIRGGFTALRTSRIALATTLLGVGSMFAIGPLQAVVLPTFFSRERAPELLGAALATVAVGLIVGALLSAPFASRAGRRTVLVAALAASLAGLVAFAVAPSTAVAIGAAITVGLGFGLLAPVLPVLVTEHVPEAARARVFGLQNAGYLAAYPLGALLIGFVVQAADVRTGAIVCAALWAVLVAFGLVTPALRARELGGRAGSGSRHPAPLLPN